MLFLIILLSILHPILLLGTIIPVTTTDGGSQEGSLNAAILQAGDGDIIDCAPIAGQTITLNRPLPAIGHNTTSPSASITLLGNGVIIDGGGFSLGYGTAVITDFILQNGISKGGDGGSGFTGGGGGTGGGGALYLHEGTTLIISALHLTNNQAIGGSGGAGNATGGSGGGGGGFGGGRGGIALSTGANAGSGGGGGGNSGGTSGGRDGGVGAPNTFSNFAGAGGGGEIPGLNSARAGGSNASIPARAGGAGGIGSPTQGAGAGGGGGGGGNGFNGSNAINATSPGTGVGGAGGLGFGLNNTYGAGGGGGGGNGGGAGYGTSGGGGGITGPGGAGGTLGGGGGGASSSPGITHRGGNGGLGAGGGGGNVGGTDSAGLGGSGGSATNAPAGGGGGSGLGGAIFVQRGAKLVLQDEIYCSGNSTTAGLGGIAAGLGSSGGDGGSRGDDICIQAGGSVTFQVEDVVTIPTPIAGAGLVSQAGEPAVILAGAGTVNLTGANTYLGGTIINSGTLVLNGSVLGDLQVASGSTLSGNATIDGSLSNKGTLSPGSSIGTITTTNLSLSPTSSYAVELSGTGASDTIIAAESAQLAGSVTVTPLDSLFTAPRTYTIISTGAGITGQFSYLTSSLPALMSMLYTERTVQLIYLPLDTLDLSCNARAAAQCFATLSALPGSDAALINNSLLALDFNSIASAFEQMSPAQFSGPTEVQLLDAILVRTTYTKHLQRWNLMKQCPDRQPITLWINGIAQWQQQKLCFGYKDTTAGGTLGVDYHTDDWIMGLAFSTTYDRFHGKECTSSATLNSLYGGLYSRWNCYGLSLTIALLGAYNTYKTTRNLRFGTVNRGAFARHTGNQLLLHFGCEYWKPLASPQIVPYFDLDYVLQHEHRFTETNAGSLNLQVAPKQSMLFQGEAGISLSTTYELRSGIVAPMLTLAYMNQTPFSNKNYCATFTESSCTYTSIGGDYRRNLFVTRLALLYQPFCDRVNCSIYYDGQLGSSYWAQDIACELRLAF